MLRVQLFIRKMNMFANDDVVIPDGLGFDLTYWRDLFPYAVVNDIGWTTQGWALVCHYVENRVGPHNPFCLSTPYFSFSTDHLEESTKPLKFERIKSRRLESMLPILSDPSTDMSVFLYFLSNLTTKCRATNKMNGLET